MYTNLPTIIEYCDYERRCIANLYFNSQGVAREESLPIEILDFLHREREKLLQADPSELASWLVTLYNIQRLYPKADFSPTGLGFYVTTFESIIPEKSVQKQKDIVIGDSSKLKSYLIESLQRLDETRDQADIAYDNNLILTISSRLIEDSFLKEDVEATLLAMIIKADYSLTFQEKPNKKFVQFKIPKFDLSKNKYYYDDRKKLLQKLALNKSDLLIWLAVTEGKVFQLSLLNEQFYFHHLEKWNWPLFYKLVDGKYFSNLHFEETIVTATGIQQVFPEEHYAQANKIAETINFTCLQEFTSAESILIVKDMDLAGFPHNLFVNSDKAFIHSELPIANILSTEWFLLNRKTEKISDDYTKSIWIPTEAGDPSLNFLYCSLEKQLHKANFNTYTTIDLDKPVSSELNIVCSHGSENIAKLQAISPGNKLIWELDNIIGKGKILVFFICHSGSYKNEILRNNVISLAKKYILSGYQAVIAPFWALNIKIPSIWLPEFLASINKNLPINIAVFNANKAVSRKFPTPSAWACMHLYGNPYVGK